MVKKIKGFLMRSNIIDLATGVVIGTAFQKIISALVDKIFMPIIGVLIGGVNLKDRYFEVLSVQFCIFSCVQSVKILKQNPKLMTCLLIFVRN
jgi:large conductance mechanosensitive channel protein